MIYANLTTKDQFAPQARAIDTSEFRAHVRKNPSTAGLLCKMFGVLNITGDIVMGQMLNKLRREPENIFLFDTAQSLLAQSVHDLLMWRDLSSAPQWAEIVNAAEQGRDELHQARNNPQGRLEAALKTWAALYAALLVIGPVANAYIAGIQQFEGMSVGN